MILSLQARLLLAALLVLMVFTGLTGLALDKAFQQSAETALQDRLQGYLYALLAAVDVDDSGMPRFTRNLPDARFNRPGSGLYASIQNTDKHTALHSRSLLGNRLPAQKPVALGEYQYAALQLNDMPHYRLIYRVRWEVDEERAYRLDFQIVEDMQNYQQQISTYRHNLWSWLAAAVLVLLILQAIILRWSLRPLRQVATDLASIEAGRAERLQGRYPKELQHLTDTLNGLLDHTRNQLQRYRDSLGNMAHSLKTPLAILTNALALKQTDAGQEAEEQLQRIRQIIDYQLHHAAAAGQTSLGKTTSLKPVSEKIIKAMQKVYADKSLQFENHIDASHNCQCDEGDLMEVLGNLLENACKWSQHRIRISAQRQQDGIEIGIEDDGPGIPSEVREQVLQRGQRADPSTSGHGIGLAMVQEIVLLYGGSLRIESSDLGGTAIYIQLP